MPSYCGVNIPTACGVEPIRGSEEVDDWLLTRVELCSPKTRLACFLFVTEDPEVAVELVDCRKSHCSLLRFGESEVTTHMLEDASLQTSAVYPTD